MGSSEENRDRILKFVTALECRCEKIRSKVGSTGAHIREVMNMEAKAQTKRGQVCTSEEATATDLGHEG